MPKIEPYEEPGNVETNDEETTDLSIVSITTEDKIALGKASKIQKQLFGDRSESKQGEAESKAEVETKRDDMIKTFTRFNNNTARNSIIRNIAILNYFEPLRESTDPKMNSIYESILKVKEIKFYYLFTTLN